MQTIHFLHSYVTPYNYKEADIVLKKNLRLESDADMICYKENNKNMSLLINTLCVYSGCI